MSVYSENLRIDLFRFNFIGIKRIRTDILIIDNYTLDQLSYSPLYNNNIYYQYSPLHFRLIILLRDGGLASNYWTKIKFN